MTSIEHMRKKSTLTGIEPVTSRSCVSALTKALINTFSIFVSYKGELPCLSIIFLVHIFLVHIFLLHIFLVQFVCLNACFASNHLPLQSIQGQTWHECINHDIHRTYAKKSTLTGLEPGISRSLAVCLNRLTKVPRDSI